MGPLIWTLIWITIVTVSTATSSQEEDYEKSKGETQYYDIYQAIDTLNRVTPHHTFYELFGVAPEANNEELSRAFRRTALNYHPDKLRHIGGWNQTTEQISNVVQFAGTLLRSPEGRKRYNWILNEAPAWHRQSVYMMRNLVQTSRLTITQVVVIVIIFSILLQLIIQWINYGVAWYMIISSKWAIREMGEKEVKRMKRRMETGDKTFLAMTNPNYHSLILAEGSTPTIPNPFDLWIFALPLFLARKLLGRKGQTRSVVESSKKGQ